MNESDLLKVAVAPLDIVYDDVSVNIRQATDVIARCASLGAEIIALPELFSTGFITDSDKLTSRAKEGGKVFDSLKRISSESNIALTGSCLAYDGSQPVNRGFIILPDGRDAYYDKRHLFCLSPEHSLVKAGKRLPPIISYKGWNLSIIVCYDLRFPAWCRNRQCGYDVMFVPANWPDVRRYAWEHLLIARSIENQAYYVGANRSGSDRFGNYDDTSLIVDPMGYPVSSKSAGIVVAALSKESLNACRTKLPAHRDADDFNFVM